MCYFNTVFQSMLPLFSLLCGICAPKAPIAPPIEAGSLQSRLPFFHIPNSDSPPRNWIPPVFDIFFWPELFELVPHCVYMYIFPVRGREGLPRGPEAERRPTPWLRSGGDADPGLVSPTHKHAICPGVFNVR